MLYILTPATLDKCNGVVIRAKAPRYKPHLFGSPDHIFSQLPVSHNSGFGQHSCRVSHFLGVHFEVFRLCGIILCPVLSIYKVCMGEIYSAVMPSTETSFETNVICGFFMRLQVTTQPFIVIYVIFTLTNITPEQATS